MQKPLLIGLIGGIAVVLAIALSLLLGENEAPAPETSTPSATQAESQAERIIPPTFDVVRVNPEGNAVMAGRAHPGSTVEVLDGDTVIGTVQTDQRGEWVFVPETLLEPGERRLGLRMLIEGLEPMLSEHVVILVVPERGQGSDGALALKVRRDGTGASEVLQKPGETDAFGVDSIDYGGGKVIISGHAEPNKTVHLYLDNQFIGRVTSDDKGLWSLTPEKDVAPGTYTLRADMVGDKGEVLARREMPFQRAEMAEAEGLEPGSFVVVQPGNSLWRLARRTYGEGLRYHTIYEANSDQIKNPDMIYPGQVFRLPAGK